jgi:hypothetical protein
MSETKVYETIFNGESKIIPMADVQHIERGEMQGHLQLVLVTCHTKYNYERDMYENAIHISDYENKTTGYKSTEASDFLKSWCWYRHGKDGVADVMEDE